MIYVNGIIAMGLSLQSRTPHEKAVAAKNRGNKYFKGGRYELAIRCYTEAIEVCPEKETLDLATFHQNRAAAHDQLVSRRFILSVHACMC